MGDPDLSAGRQRQRPATLGERFVEPGMGIDHSADGVPLARVGLARLAQSTGQPWLGQKPPECHRESVLVVLLEDQRVLLMLKTVIHGPIRRDDRETVGQRLNRFFADLLYGAGEAEDVGASSWRFASCQYFR